MTDGKSFGERVRYFRNHRHWTQEELAARADLSQAEVSKIETGKYSGQLTEETIQKLAQAFEIAPEMLVRGTGYASLFGQSGILYAGSVDDGPPITAYFASALTGLTDEQMREVEDLDQAVDEVCRTYNSYPVVLYRPRLKTSPKDNPDISAAEVYAIDQERVATADLIILAAVYPSLGAGMELQLAYQSCSAVILLTKRGSSLSRMVLGCPARKEIVEYSNLSDLGTALIEALNRVLPLLAESRFSNLNPQTAIDIHLGQRISQLREQRRLSTTDLARMVGVDHTAIESLEAKSEHVVNPSLLVLRRVAKALCVSEAFLVTGYEVPIQHHNPIFDQHQKSLRSVASELGMSVDDFEQLWKVHVDKYAYELAIPGTDHRADIGDAKYWKKKYEEHKKENGKQNQLFDRSPR